MTTSSVVENFLEHYGVKGMKWGVRRKNHGGLSKTEFKKSQDRQRAERLMRKGAKALSNQELKDVNNRLNLEQNYNRMNPSPISKGRKAAQEIITTIGVATTMYSLSKSLFAKNLTNQGAKFIKQAAKR